MCNLFSIISITHKLKNTSTTHMFEGSFFKGIPNFVFLEMLEAISKVQVYFENDIYMDYDIEWFIFTTLHVIHVYRPVFQGESEFCGFRNARGHHEGPGVPREQHTQGLRELY